MCSERGPIPTDQVPDEDDDGRRPSKPAPRQRDASPELPWFRRGHWPYDVAMGLILGGPQTIRIGMDIGLSAALAYATLWGAFWTVVSLAGRRSRVLQLAIVLIAVAISVATLISIIT